MHTRRELLRLAAAAGAGAALAGPLPRIGIRRTHRELRRRLGRDAAGARGEPERVIIVGAGWAGLTVANALRNAGVDHVVLEGRDRIGGRAHTVDLDGVPVDLGCSWIHESDRQPDDHASPIRPASPAERRHRVGRGDLPHVGRAASAASST